MKKPFHRLEDVWTAVTHQKVILKKERALRPLIIKAGGISAAFQLVCRELRALDDGAFAHTLVQSFTTCDVYGATIDGEGWYIKLYLDVDPRGDDQVVCISFHPLEKPLRTNRGVVTP